MNTAIVWAIIALIGLIGWTACRETYLRKLRIRRRQRILRNRL